MGGAYGPHDEGECRGETPRGWPGARRASHNGRTEVRAPSFAYGKRVTSVRKRSIFDWCLSLSRYADMTRRSASDSRARRCFKSSSVETVMMREDGLLDTLGQPWFRAWLVFVSTEWRIRMLTLGVQGQDVAATDPPSIGGRWQTGAVVKPRSMGVATSTPPHSDE